EVVVPPAAHSSLAEEVTRPARALMEDLSSETDPVLGDRSLDGPSDPAPRGRPQPSVQARVPEPRGLTQREDRESRQHEVRHDHQREENGTTPRAPQGRTNV